VILLITLQVPLRSLPTEMHFYGKYGEGKALNHTIYVRAKRGYGDVRVDGVPVFYFKDRQRRSSITSEDVWERAKKALSLYGDSSVLVAVWEGRETHILGKGTCAYINFTYPTEPQQYYYTGDTLVIEGGGWVVKIPKLTSPSQRRGPIYLTIPPYIKVETVRGHSYPCRP